MTDSVKCSTGSPCDCCLKGDEDSLWKAIGCRRGPLECHIPRAIFCPAAITDGSTNTYLLAFKNKFANDAFDAATVTTSRTEELRLPFQILLPTGMQLKAPGNKVLKVIQDISEIISRFYQTFTDPSPSILHIFRITGIFKFDFIDLIRSVARSYVGSSNVSLVCITYRGEISLIIDLVRHDSYVSGMLTKLFENLASEFLWRYCCRHTWRLFILNLHR